MLATIRRDEEEYKNVDRRWILPADLLEYDSSGRVRRECFLETDVSSSGEKLLILIDPPSGEHKRDEYIKRRTEGHSARITKHH